MKHCNLNYFVLKALALAYDELIKVIEITNVSFLSCV